MAEAQKAQEAKVPDPIQDLIDRALKEDPDATKYSIQEKMDALKDNRETLVEQFGKEKDASKQAKINEQIGKIDKTFPILEAKGKKLLEKAVKGLVARTDLAEDEASLKIQLDAKTTEEIGLAPGSPELTKVLKEKGEIQKKLDRLTGTEKAKERLEKAKAFQGKAKEVHAEEEKFADQKLIDDLAGKPSTQEKPGEKPAEQAPSDATKPAETPAAPNAPAAAPENNPSLSDQADRFAGNMVVNIIGSPPKTGWEKFTTNTKVILMQIGLAIAGGGNHSWGRQLSEPEREIAKKVMGLTITDDGEVPAVETTVDKLGTPAIPKCKLEWGKPDPEFIGPDKTTQEVLFSSKKYFEPEDGFKAYERVCSLVKGGDPTIQEVEDSYSTPHTAEDDKLAQLITDLGVGDQKDAKFLDMVSRKGYLVLDKDTPAVETSDSEEAAPQSKFDMNDFLQDPTKGTVAIIKDKNLDSKTTTKQFFDTLGVAITGAPVEQLQLDLAKAPEADVLKIMDQYKGFTESQKTTMIAELDKEGHLSADSCKIVTDLVLHSGIDQQLAISPQSDHLKTAIENNTPFAKYLQAEIEAKAEPLAYSIAVLKALRDNDKDSAPAPAGATVETDATTPTPTPSSPTAS